MPNRLTPEESEVFTAARLWWRHRTPENLNTLRRAITAWIRSENAEAA